MGRKKKAKERKEKEKGARFTLKFLLVSLGDWVGYSLG